MRTILVSGADSPPREKCACLCVCSLLGRVDWQVIASATETEITTDHVTDMLPPDQFFRFNPRMNDMPIDEVRKERLDWLKVLANEYFEV